MGGRTNNGSFAGRTQQPRMFDNNMNGQQAPQQAPQWQVPAPPVTSLGPGGFGGGVPFGQQGPGPGLLPTSPQQVPFASAANQQPMGMPMSPNARMNGMW